MAVAAQARRSAAGRIASPELKSVFRRRLAEIGALLLALGGMALLVSLVGYDSHDPSLNTATARATTNLVGPPGAMVSDLLLQGFGVAGVLPGLAMLSWAWRIAMTGGLSGLPLRLAALLAAMPVLAGVFATIPVPGGVTLAWPAAAGLGGAAGRSAAHQAMQAGALMIGPFGPACVVALGLILALTLSLLALGLTAGEWRAAGRAAQTTARGGSRAMGFFGRVSARVAGGVLALLDRINGTRPEERRESRGRGRPDPEGSPGPQGAARNSSDGGATQGEFRASSPGSPIEPAAFIRPDPRAAVPVRAERKPSDARLGKDAREAPAANPSPAPASLPAISARALASVATDNAKPQAPPRPASAPARQESVKRDAGWRFPTLDLLTPAPSRATIGAPSEEALAANARLLETVLGDYGVQGQIVEIRPGPVVTLYELEPAPGIRSARVIGLADDVARSLCVTAVRIATVSGRNVIGIEVPNAKRETVFLSELIASGEWARQQGRLALALGKDISGAPVIADLARMPHLLVAGTTGSGKSVGINAMILSLLFRMSPDQCRLILIDPKMLELSVYEGIPHLLAPVVTEPAKAVSALKWTVREMERRYRSMSQLSVRNIGGYNERVAEARAESEIVTRRVQTGFDSETGRPVFEDQKLALEPLPLIVVVIDEMADLMMVAGKEIEAAVQRLAQMARAAGIHVVMATQRPSVDVITGTIKANFPTRMSFQVISKFDSRTILGEQGAEQLLGQGDMLYMVGGGKITRVHGPYVSDREVEQIVDFLRGQGEPAYVEEITETPEDGREPGLSGMTGASDGEKGLFDQAVDIVSREGKASVSFIQRHLQIGYNRAARLMEQMEKEGIVGPANRVGKREILTRRVSDED